ncbi:MAG: MotA/TolQ/ExbB proton channel family protein [Planctomycetales bacterium]|nr:MotA/TolQ/ExbB proton channel family protein [Planctomycetales bacterium]
MRFRILSRFNGPLGAMLCVLLVSWFVLPTLTTSGRLSAQTPADAGLETLAADAEFGAPADDNPASAEAEDAAPALDLFSLMLKGGWLMIPIALMSLAVGAIIVERLIALRRKRVLPADLVEGLSDLGGVPGVMDPRRAYRLCQENPSAAAMVIRSMLLKIGRPQSEVEHAVAETSNREAERLYGSARWLTLIAAVAPLTGLLGTVWGMIRAFYDTTHLAAGQNKADFLAQGIYVALVTTLGGLVVAIPAAVAAHYFEGKVVALFHEIDELLFNLLPQVERYEGRLRVTPHSLGNTDDDVTRTAVAPDPHNPALR